MVHERVLPNGQKSRLAETDPSGLFPETRSGRRSGSLHRSRSVAVSTHAIGDAGRRIDPAGRRVRVSRASAPTILRLRRAQFIRRTIRLFGVSATVWREPLGTILIIGPQNYPLMLSGIQAVQALVCGVA